MIKIDFEKYIDGLVPTIIQDGKTGIVYMLGYMSKESLSLTHSTGFVHFYSRSRKKIWLKGEESGNKLKVVSIDTDCDNDALLIKTTLIGKAVCHTGKPSCFFNKI